MGNGTQVRAVPNFESIRGLEDHKVVSVACGWIHSVALTSRGQVWVWGSNSHSQLGLPTNEVLHFFPIIYSQSNTCFVLLESNVFF